MKLHVIDHTPAAWFLLRDGESSESGDYYLDVNCDMGPVGFSVLVKLSDAEREEHRKLGRAFVESLAGKITEQPGLYRDRDLSRSLGADVTDAVKRFRYQQ